MGISGVGHVLGLDPEGIVDEYFMGILQFLSACASPPVVDGQTDGLSQYRGLCGYIVYLSRSEPVNEEFA
jgi:hypothetical protein